MRKWIIILLALFCLGFRSTKPPTLTDPLDEKQIRQLSDYLQTLWDIDNGRQNLDAVTTSKTKADDGDIWIYTGATSAIEYKSGGTVYRLTPGSGFTDRGDPGSPDFTQADLTQTVCCDDLDLSSIITDTSASAALMYLRISDNNVAANVTLRANGKSNQEAICRQYTQIGGTSNNITCIIPLDSSNIIEYYISEAFVNIDLTVLGWWK